MLICPQSHINNKLAPPPMSKKGSKHPPSKHSHPPPHDDDSTIRLPEDHPQGSAKRRLKKLSEVNVKEEMLEPSGEEDNPYLVSEPEEEQEGHPHSKHCPAGGRRDAAESLIKGKATGKSSSLLDRFVEKEKEREVAKKEGKERPRVQLTLGEAFRLKKQQQERKPPPPPSKKSQEMPVKESDISSEEPQVRQARRAEEYNGGIQDEQKLIEMAIKLSLTATTTKHENLEDYAYQQEQPIIKPISKGSKGPIRHPSPPKAERPPSHFKQVKSEPKKQVKRTKSMSKQAKTGPLAGMVIAFTGGYQGYDKDKLIEVCEQLGAECPKSITRKCNLLLQGSHVEDHFKRRLPQPIEDTNKSKEARERGIRIIPFSELEDYFMEKTGATLDDHINKNAVTNHPISSFVPKHSLPKKEQEEPMDLQRLKPPPLDGRLWTEKYKPSRLDEVIGEGSQIRALREWLQSWQDIHLRGNKREVKESKGWNAGGNINSPGALISGDPGIGKTTTARLLAAEYNYSVTEFNASDVRNKSGVSLLESGSYNLDLFHNLTRPLVIMDEVDGMSSGDRGGVAAIISLLKQTKIPVICICNDRSSEKIRSLAAHCLDVKFHKPNKGQIVRRLKEILVAEGGSGEDRALEQLVETFQNDMRQLLSYLQVVFRTVSRRITVDALSARSRSAKDASVMINHFDAARRLLNRTEFSGMKIQQRTECFFVDSDIVPLMVHENLLASAGKTALGPKDFHRLVQGLRGITLGDVLDRTIRKQQEWGLMPSFGFMTCVYPTEKISESVGFPQFPAWLGKFSSERKMRRLAKEFKNAIFPITTVGSNRTAKNLYAPIIAKELAEMLRQDTVEEAACLMEQYRIGPTMVGQHLLSLYYTPLSPNPLADVPAATKAKLTRLYNKRHEEARLAKAKAKGKGGNKEQQKHIKFDPLMEEPEEQGDDEPQPEPEVESDKEKSQSLGKVKGKAKSKGKPRKK